MPKRIQVDKGRLADFCRRSHIARLSFFGSALHEGFSADSDIDVLVDFEDGHTPGFLRIAQIERELSVLLDNQKADLRTLQDLSRYFRSEVLATAEVQYAQA
ncbi:MAG: nucleotidyltransferase family protein [Pyrinomonadaceae bacterium]